MPNRSNERNEESERLNWTTVAALFVVWSFGAAAANAQPPARSLESPALTAYDAAQVSGSPISNGEYTDCRPTAASLVFDGGYRVSMCYETAQGTVGEAQAGIWASGQSGLLWFFDRDNAEVLVKVLDGCSHNGRRWVFVAPVTDVAFNLHVTSSSGRQWTHRNRLGATATTRSDTSAFVCADDDGTASAVPTGMLPENVTKHAVAKSPISRGEYTDCRPATTPLAFDGGYRVSMCYETAQGVVGEAQAGIWASNQSGLLWFFDRDNAEVLVKVLDGCSHNGSRWIFVAPVTDVAFNLHVMSVGGREWTHRNRLGETATAASDTSAFDCATEDGVLETVSVSSASAEEGAAVEFTVTQSGPARSDTVLRWSTASGTAESGEDFTAVTAGTLTIPAGDTTGALRVSTVEDTLVEVDETFTVTIAGAMLPRGVTLGSGTAIGTIVDNDAEAIPVDIPDAGLRKAIEDTLGLASGASVTSAHLSSLRRLDARDRNIRDLTGLEFAKNLKDLFLWANAITDISPLAGLTNLTYLGLGSNEITDISPLASLTNLTLLGLFRNEITEISALAGLTNLISLGIQSNQITDISLLAGLTNLIGIGLSHNEITDISPLAGLTNLTTLGLGGNTVTDVSALAGLTNLTRLALGGNTVTDVSALAGLTNLTRLELGFNEVTDVSPLVRLTNLTLLRLEGNLLDHASLEVHVPALLRRGVKVYFDSFRKGAFDIELVFLGDAWSGTRGRKYREQTEWAARRWTAVVSGDLTDHTFSQEASGECGESAWEISPGERIDDLRVYVASFDGGRGIVGYGGPTHLREDGFPSLGCMVLDLQGGYIPVVAAHELGHVLGIGTIWHDFVRTSSDPHFSGPLAVAAFDDAGGVGYAGAKVPLQSASDTAHWRIPVLGGELMDPGGGALSAITVQALADLGYGVDVSQADEYSLPGSATATSARGAMVGEPFAWTPRRSAVSGDLGVDGKDVRLLSYGVRPALAEPAPFCGVRGAGKGPIAVVGREE